METFRAIRSIILEDANVQLTSVTAPKELPSCGSIFQQLHMEAAMFELALNQIRIPTLQ